MGIDKTALTLIFGGINSYSSSVILSLLLKACGT